LTKQHAEVLGGCLDKPAELLSAVVEALRYLVRVSALRFTSDQVFRESGLVANWPNEFVEALCVADETVVEQLALSLMELRRLQHQSG
jgi:hypothetical protein